jgi:hypothetical protein
MHLRVEEISAPGKWHGERGQIDAQMFFGAVAFDCTRDF